ncbi:FtsX-like permease family protein [Lentilactobacillus sp. Marseille-Q4993]|uniref:ABC transporter permease n=1 Tax=Lentilactobacillus sp. Marseille-Q4993 TaxID=3039492 RepID=UPI0024BC7B7F|nr:FtsX-like permease family protein [Lentilactobacillus sp. Marseille-Q4993]
MNKLLFRNIKGSLGRFFAIALIIMLGVLIFVGVKATGPALNDSLQSEVKTQRLSDVQVISDKGFTDKDVKAAEKVSGAKAEAVKYKTAIGGKNRDAVAVYGYKKNAKQNKLIIRSGHLPKKANEIVLDSKAKKDEGYKLGDSFKFAKSAKLKQRTYKVVGFADSVQYIDNSTRGAANIGNGQVQFFAYVTDKAMNMPVNTAINVRFNSLDKYATFSKKYKNAVDDKVSDLKRELNDRKADRANELAGPALKKLDAAQTKLDDSQKQLDKSKAALKKASNGQMTANSQLTSAQKRIDASKKKLVSQRAKVEKATKPTYLWSTREDFPGFSGYGDSSDRIAAIANVFPLFFFLLAALITFTTVTRMVEESRGQIGTLKALGFSKGSIAYQYVMYAFYAALLGIVGGSLIGNLTLPRFVLSMYKTYVLKDSVVNFDWVSIGLAVILALISTVGAAFIVISKEVRVVPSELMRPKAPKSAKKILLERITFIWSRLKFNQKISYRNLFRFKSRGFMTILGIAGGTALILTGFGLDNSISGSGKLQYGNIIHYDAVVQSKTPAKLASVQRTVKKGGDYRDSARVATGTVKASNGNGNVADITVYAPENKGDFKKFINVRDDKTKKPLKISDDGVIITEKMAKKLKVKKGDTISLARSGQSKTKAKVIGIAENYVSNFIYTTKNRYQKFMHEKPEVKTLLVKLHNTDKSKETKLGKKWITDNSDILGISFTRDQQKTLSNMASQMGPVVWIFILLSGLLSFIVLYNLNNINVSERLRELSTIKVLGFFDPEVTMYVARESIILAIVGIVAGYGLGTLLTVYVLHQAATTAVIFPLIIKPLGYVVATILMIMFNLIVIMLTHRRLKRVDMVEALKSNE